MVRFQLTSRFVFTPSLWPTIALLLVLPLLVSLGLWQLQRANEKETLQIQKAARTGIKPIRITGKIIDAEGWNHYPALVQGRYDPKFHILLDNRIHNGHPGYYVITPFKVKGGEVRILINRGWIPLGQSRTRLPVIDTPTGDELVEGRTRLSYADRYLLDSEPEQLTDGLNVWQTIEPVSMSKLVAYPMQPVIVELDPGSKAGGFLREWGKSTVSPPSKNIGYAVQWFALASLVMGLYLVLNIHKSGT